MKDPGICSLDRLFITLCKILLLIHIASTSMVCNVVLRENVLCRWFGPNWCWWFLILSWCACLNCFKTVTKHQLYVLVLRWDVFFFVWIVLNLSCRWFISLLCGIVFPIMKDCEVTYDWTSTWLRIWLELVSLAIVLNLLISEY